MLYIWTGADAKDIKNSMGPTLTEQRVPHRFVPNMTCFPQSASSEDVVLVCGAKAVELLVSFGVLPKNRTVNSLRERMFSYQGVRFFVTFDPGLVNRDYARLSDIIWDLMLVCRLITTGSLAPVIGTYRYVESLHELIEYVEAKYEATGKAVDLACDLETKSLVPQVPDAWIIACSFTVEVGKSDVLYFDKGEAPVCPPAGLAEESMDYWQGLWCQINWLLTTPKVSLRGANFKYDENWLVEKWGILPTNQKFDTVLAGSLLDENRSNSLKLHAKLFTPMGGYEDDMDKYDFGCLEEVPKPEMLNYVGGDTDVTYRVAQHMKPQLLKDRALSNFYVKLLQPSAKVFAKMERTGVLIDQKIYADLKAELEGEIHRLSHEMLVMLPPKLRFRHHEKIEKALAEGKSPFIPALMKEFFFSPYGMNLKPKMLTEKTKEASTSVDHLMMFEDDPEAKAFVEKFRELGSTTKTYSTYVVGFLKHLRPDGRFHPSYMLFKGDYGDKADSGADTGRTSAKDPAIQTLTKHNKWAKPLRRAYIAPPGYIILNVDFSQGELRIAAVLAEEPTMIKAYQNNMDLHSITAAQISGYEFEEFMLLPDDVRDELRSGGKAGNFGLLYGMQHLGFKDYAYYSYGVKMTEEEAFNRRQAFFDLYSKLPEWHEAQKNFAKLNGYVRSPLGRVRHLPLLRSSDREMRSKAERQAINSPVQSCLSDMMQLAMVHIDREYGHEDIHFCIMCHDAVTLYVPEADAIEWAVKIKAVMENLPLEKDFHWHSPLKFVADAEVGSSLESLKKLKGL